MTFEAPNISVNYSGTLPRVPFLAIKEKILGKKYDLSIAFVTPQKAQSINMSQRNKDYVPNTLSFSLSKDSGEIILCKSMLQQEYREFGMTYDNYIIFILIHSMLHLKGFAHGSTMENKEEQFLKFFTSQNKNETSNSSRH